MDSNSDPLLDLENLIGAIFNGFPVVAAPPGQQKEKTTPDLPGQPTAHPSTSYPAKIDRSQQQQQQHHGPSPPALVDDGDSDGDDDDDDNNDADGAEVPRPRWELDPTGGVHVDKNALGGLMLSPDLDMSSAIDLSQKLRGKRSHTSAFGAGGDPTHRPRFMSMGEACQVPEKAMRDDLVKLYFEHFHPFCPVVDEFDFMEFYDSVTDEEHLTKNMELPLFQAMMFVAIGHMSSAQLRNTPYSTIFEGQRAYFDRASFLYRMRYTSDHMVLTKVAVILTYWSPFDSQYQVNNYWVDRAFYHARAISLWKPQGGGMATPSRRQIVWWCCLLRDRLVSFGLRRPYRIQEAESTWPIVSHEDFGIEAMYPKFVGVSAKRAVIDSFIWLCKLSDVMRDIAVFHEKNRFDREWSDSSIGGGAIMPELSQISKFDNQLKGWKEGYREVSGEYIKASTPRLSKMPHYVLIISDSVLAALYLPYIHCPAGSIQLVQKFQRVALRRIKAASSAVALSTRRLNNVAKVGEEIMVGIIAWIALPMAVFKVLTEIDGDAAPDPNAGNYSDFVLFLGSLAERFHAAKVLADMMVEATSTLVERSTDLGIVRKGAPSQGNDLHGAVSSNSTGHTKDVEEAEVLNCVAKMVDLRLSADVSK